MDPLEGRPIAPFKEDAYGAVENIDITETAHHYASDACDTDPNQPRPQFDPCWRHSEVTPEETEAEDQEDQDVGSDSASGDTTASRLDQAHLREENRLLSTGLNRT